MKYSKNHHAVFASSVQFALVSSAIQCKCSSFHDWPSSVKQFFEPNLKTTTTTKKKHKTITHLVIMRTDEWEFIMSNSSRKMCTKKYSRSRFPIHGPRHVARFRVAWSQKFLRRPSGQVRRGNNSISEKRFVRDKFKLLFRRIN